MVFNYFEDGKHYIAFSDLEAEKPSYFTFKELDMQVSDFIIEDDFLYFTSYDNGEVYKLDLNNSEADPVRILDGLQNPRIKLEDVTDVFVVANLSTVDVSPNPTSNLLNIGEKKNLLYSIYSINGISVIEGNLSGDGQIDVTHLP